MDRITLSNRIAIVATILAVSGLIFSWGFGNDNIGVPLLFVGMFASLVSYILCGFFRALGAAWNISKWGLVSVPFPMNLVITPVIGLFAIGALLVCPIAITRNV